MKITLVLLFCTVFTLFAENTHSQNAKVTILRNNVALQEILNEIEEQTEYLFLYNKKNVDVDRSTSIYAENKSVAEVLNNVLKDTKVNYEMVGKHIVLSDQIDEVKNTLQARRTITGTVVDVRGDAMIGVNVVQKGTTTGVITDINGNFSITVPENIILQISYIGYLTQEVAVESQKTIRIVLEEDALALDEVVIVSYGTQLKRQVTGSISTIKAESLSDLPVGQIGQKLQGQIAGVQINQSTGAPGQGMAFRIRGATSINNSNQPLIVLDGLPISAGLNNINPDEIESFSVLKDAAATSLYGSRAANGVILITTKGGKKGKLTASFSAYYGIQTMLGQKEMEMMNGQEFAQFKKEYYEDKAKYEDPSVTVPEYYQNPEKYGKGTDWYKLMLRSSAPTQNYSLSLSGGTDRFQSSVVLGFIDQKGITKNSGFTRASLRANNNFQLNDKIKIGLNVAPVLQSYNNQATDGDRQILSATMLADPTVSPYKDDGSIKISLESPGMFPQPNWLYFIDNRLNNTRILTMLANAFVDVDIWKGLKYKLQTGVDLGNYRQREWASSLSGGGLFTAPPVKANSFYNTWTYYNWSVENLLSYDRTFGDHEVGGLIGYSAQKYNRENSELSGTDFPDDDISWIEAAATKNGKANMSEWALISFIARANYSYKNRYMLQATFRRDGSSRFGPENRYASFPSVSAGWVVSDEAFMNPVKDVMNYLKLRASYGLTGNYNIGDYSYIANMKSANYVLNGTLASGQALSNIGNNTLTWEESKQFDIGIDLGFFNDRLTIMYDYYFKKTDGLLYQVNLPISTGFGNIAANVGQFDNWGHEIDIQSRNLIGDFKWKTNLNLTIARSKVKELSTNNVPIGGNDEYYDWNRLEVGKPIGVFSGYVFDGVYMTQEEFDSQPKHATSDIGTVRMKDISGPDGTPDGKIDIYDRTIIGDPNPDLMYGLTNEFSWKNFDLSILVNGQIGGDVFLGAYENMLNLDGVFNVLKDVKNRWRSPENPGNGKIPRTKTNTTQLYRMNHSGWVYNASYLTLKNITLGYTIPIKPNNYISKARVYFTAQQLFTWTKYPGTNPEINTSNTFSWQGMGVDRTATPIPKTFSIGCNITF